ncbi:LAME_0D08878g1_1 [Lachancea meyersii CBS 8951]|uniref:LAME_0D08878g1_1 n=1 Tax=Lachancea meyersii CBS 8951 TaxID=1266667 RepID=A0A1G4JBB1_9SACH|nr:LAME_0D08878g1_1 [Lachancea meyersii CBS 8951]
MDLRSRYTNRELRPFYAGSGAIASVSEDGQLLATSVVDEVIITELGTTKRILHKIENDDEQEITALKLTPDGKFLAFMSQAQLLRVYDLSAKRITRSMKISSPVYVMDCDSSSTLMALGGTDGSVTVVDVENGYVTHSFKGHGGTISSVKFYGELNSTTWRLASGDTNGMVKVWDLVRRNCLYTIQEHAAAVRGLDLRLSNSADQNSLELLSGGRDDIVNLHQLGPGKKVKLLKTIPVSQQIEACGFIQVSENNDSIYTAGGEAVFQIISLDSGNVIKKTEKPIEELFIIGVLPILQASKVYLVLSDQTLFLADLEASFEASGENIVIKSKIAGNHGTVADMRFVGPELNLLALATNSPGLRIVPTAGFLSQKKDLAGDLDNLKDSEGKDDDSTSLPLEVEVLEGHTDLLNAVDSTEDGTWLASCSKDNTAILWRFDAHLDTFEMYAKFTGHAGPVTAVGLPNVLRGDWPAFIITASNDLTIKKWAVPKPTGKNEGVHIVKASEYTRRAHEKDINALSISPNDSIFATASYDKTCKVWNVDTGELEGTLAGHKRGLWDVSFCQYDKLLATASGDKTVKIWSLETFSVQKTLEGHTNAVQKCSFINKNKQVVTTGADGLIKLWDLSSGECLRTLDAHDNRIWALSVLQDGEEFATADADGLFQFWRDNSEEEAKQNLEDEKLRITQEQSLQNYLSKGDWTNAFLLAMTLDHPMRLYRVLDSSSHAGDENSSHVFNEELDTVIGSLEDEQVLNLLKRSRDWNTNATTHSVAQKVIRCILMRHNIAALSDIPGIMNIIDAIIPYTERHFARVDDLVEQSYILDYSLVEMDKLM